jgi:2-polyprenyl-3-methyl-5-hydroxy-6-metoxy-1,4-benzoquinol methylase
MEPLTYEGIYDFLHEKILMDVQFYKNEFKNEERILELGCGTGRIMIPLFENGISAEGIDISEKMIKVFKSKLEKV